MAIITLISCNTQRNINQFVDEWQVGNGYVIPKPKTSDSKSKYLCISKPVFKQTIIEYPTFTMKDTHIRISNHHFHYKLLPFDCSDSINYQNHVTTKIAKIEISESQRRLTFENGDIRYRKLVKGASIRKVNERHLRSCENEHLEINYEEKFILDQGGYDCRGFHLQFEFEKLLYNLGYNIDANRIISDSEKLEIIKFKKENNLPLSTTIDIETIKFFDIDLLKSRNQNKLVKLK